MTFLLLLSAADPDLLQAERRPYLPAGLTPMSFLLLLRAANCEVLQAAQRALLALLQGLSCFSRTHTVTNVCTHQPLAVAESCQPGVLQADRGGQGLSGNL